MSKQKDPIVNFKAWFYTPRISGLPWAMKYDFINSWATKEQERRYVVRAKEPRRWAGHLFFYKFYWNIAMFILLLLSLDMAAVKLKTVS